MKSISANIARLPLLVLLLISLLSNSIGASYMADPATAIAVEFEKKKEEKGSSNDLVIKQASFEAVIPFVQSFIPQSFYSFLIRKPLVILEIVCTSPQTELSMPVFLQNIFSNIIASNAP